jgi:hypothetical protein
MEKQLKLNMGTRGNYDALKEYNGQSYTGMEIGSSHEWNYNNGIWRETKITPDKWTIQFQSLKTRTHSAPDNTGAKLGAQYHWYIIADQKVKKLDANSYDTQMNGVKFKVGHREPNWKHWSYQYSGQQTYKQQIISILEQILKELKQDSN